MGTIIWGEWNGSGGNQMRIGFDISVTGVSSGTPSITWTIDVYTQNQYAYHGNTGHLNYYQDLPLGMTAFTNNEGTSPVYRETKTWTYTYSTFGSSPGHLHLSAEVHDGMNAIPFVTVTVDIPPRPYDPPAPPSAVVLTRNSDTQVTLNWTRNATTAAPYNNQTVQLRRWDGATAWTEASWASIASVSGTATSYVKNGLEANHAYQLRIRSENAFASSAWVESNIILMSPAAPSGVTSAMNSTGSAITTTWTDQAYTYPATGTWKIQRSVNGGAFADLGTVAGKTPTSYTDNTANTTVSNAYRVAAVVGALLSAYAVAPTVPAATPPLAPTLLSPNGSSVDFVNDGAVLTWQHNPGATGVIQTHFTIEKSINAGSTWTALAGATDVASTASSFTLAPGVLSNGVPYLWRVRTEGIVAAGYGPNSAGAAVTGSTKPTVTRTLPTSSTNTYKIIASWVYAQAELYPQAGYQVRLYDSTGTVLLEEINGFDDASSVIFAYAAVSGTSYVVTIAVKSSLGIWSTVSSITTAYVLFPPANVTSSGEYQLCTGTVLLHFAPTAAVVGVTVDIESITLERRTPGSDWVTLATGLLIPTDFLDTLPATHGVNEYRITAVSATPSRATMPLLVVEGADGLNEGDPLWAWVSYGDNFEFDLRVHGELDITETTGRVKAQQYFLGRPKPVALVGQNTRRAVSVGGSLFYDQRCAVPSAVDLCTYDSPPAAWSEAGITSEVVCYRDFTGRRLFGTLSDISVKDTLWPGMGQVGFSVTEVDFTERYVQLVEA
jgi:hypothetical protein